MNWQWDKKTVLSDNWDFSIFWNIKDISKKYRCFFKKYSGSSGFKKYLWDLWFKKYFRRNCSKGEVESYWVRGSWI